MSSPPFLNILVILAPMILLASLFVAVGAIRRMKEQVFRGHATELRRLTELLGEAKSPGDLKRFEAPILALFRECRVKNATLTRATSQIVAITYAENGLRILTPN